MIEPSRRKIALVDWDNTFRKGFTVEAWVEFLAGTGLFSELVAIKATVEQFRRGAIEYEPFCRKMAEIYAAGLVGQALSDISEAGASFVAADNQLFDFVAPLCAYLAEQDIKVIVVSGAPEDSLKHYAKSVGFELGGALRLVSNGRQYTGGIAENCGLAEEKEGAVARLTRSNEVVIAMGDAESDRPLLKVATVGFVVLGAKHDSVPTDPSFVRFESESDPRSVIELVKRHLSARS